MRQGLIEIPKAEKFVAEPTQNVAGDQVFINEATDQPSASLTQKPSTGKWSKLARVAFIALFAVAVIIILINFDLSGLQAFIDQHEKLAFIICLAAMIISGLTLVIPTAPVTLFIALLMGPIPAILITIFGNLITALVHYQVGKQIGDVVNFEEKKARLPFNLGKLPVTSPLFLLIGRGIPGGPKGFSFICGAYSVPLILYIWTTFITELLGAIFIAYGGDKLMQLF